MQYHSHRHNTTYTIPQPSSQHHLYNATAIVTTPLIQCHSHRHHTTYAIPQPSSPHHLYNTTAIVTTPFIQYHSHRHNTSYAIQQPSRVAGTTEIPSYGERWRSHSPFPVSFFSHFAPCKPALTASESVINVRPFPYSPHANPPQWCHFLLSKFAISPFRQTRPNG